MLSKLGQDEIRGRVANPKVLGAFDLIVARMEKLEPFQIKEGFNGPKKSLSFSTGRVSYYAFIANAEWLLWYFRRPGFNAGVFSWEELENEFPKLMSSNSTDSRSAEGKLKISNASDADHVMQFVEARMPRTAGS